MWRDRECSLGHSSGAAYAGLGGKAALGADAVWSMMRRRAGDRAWEAPDLCSSQVPLRSLHGGEQTIPEAVSSGEQRSDQGFPSALYGQVEGVRGCAARDTLRLLRFWMPMRRMQGGKHRLCSPTPREHGSGMRLPVPARRLKVARGPRLIGGAMGPRTSAKQTTRRSSPLGRSDRQPTRISSGHGYTARPAGK